MIRCFHCEHELIWGGDHDAEDDEGGSMIESNLSCPNCNAFYLVWLPIDES